MIRRIMLALLPIISVSSAAMSETCTVADPTGTPLNVRRSPNGQIVGALSNGVPVSIRERRGDWVSVAPSTGRSGWVAQKYLDCAGPSAERAAACASNDPKNSGFCHVYMTAVADTLTFMRGAMKDNFPICVTGNVTSKQLGDVVVEYIRDNPRDRHLNAATIAALAFKDAWPCESGRGK
jgi:hypothetical protein